METDSPTLSDRYDRDAWLAELCNQLPDDFTVVTSPVVQRVSLQAVVISPQGLIVLHPQGQKQQTNTNLADDLRETHRALDSYMRDEFPRLKVKISHFVVLEQPEPKLAGHLSSRKAQVVLRSDLAHVLTTQIPHTANQNLDQLTRDTIATALLTRPLSRNQRATKPFEFRSGNALGGDRRAWTLQQLFSHMARYPADGVYHIENGTLERWLSDEGVPDLARLVLELASSDRENPRASLEELLARSGLAKESGIGVRPRGLDFGKVITGGKLERTIAIFPLSRLGYVAANLKTDASWLHLEPEEVKGSGATVHVHVDTTHLPIQVAPYEANIVLTSPLVKYTITLPVKVFVMGLPSLIKRVLLRPLVGLVCAAAIGGTIGLAMGMWGMAAPSWLTSLVPTFSSIALWATIFGLVWAIGGLVRGFRQPFTTSTGRALLRWLGTTALWLIPFAILSVTTAWALGIVYSSLVEAQPALQNTIVIGALGLAIIPSVLDRDRSLPRQKMNNDDKPHTRRPLIVAVASVVLALAIVGSIFLFPSFWSSASLGNSKVTVIGWVTNQFASLRSWLDQRTEQYYLTNYDHRAPAQLTPLPSATVERTKSP